MGATPAGKEQRLMTIYEGTLTFKKKGSNGNLGQYASEAALYLVRMVF